MKTTDYFKNSVMVRRPFLQVAWIEHTVQNPVRKAIQENGRIRYWAYIEEIGKYLRVVLEPDGETVHNAFPDRSFKP